MKVLSQATLVEPALAGAIRGYTPHGHREGGLKAKRGGPSRFDRIETAFALPRDLRVAAVEVRLAPAPVVPRPYRRGRPAALAALDPLQGDTRTSVPTPVPGRRATA
ncbi:hypothetical protein [Lysobacter sp. TAB13]|uniref:hypothetical protein n=1 Tax=Lysobacter sp. TAB13 TaxID=3233065 RepID=UPI003F9E90EC